MKNDVVECYKRVAESMLEQHDSLYKATRETAMQVYDEFPDVKNRTIRDMTSHLRSDSEPYNLLSDKIRDEDNVEDLSKYLKDERMEYNDESDVYTFYLDSLPRPLEIPGEKHRSILRDYSNWSGDDDTIDQICRKYPFFRREIFMEYKRVVALTHTSSPFSTEEMKDRDIDDMVKDLESLREQELWKQWEKKQQRNTEKQAKKWRELDTFLKQPIEQIIESNVPDYSVEPFDIPEREQDYMLVASVFDLHYGKSAWADQTGEGYDTETAKQRLRDKTEYILSKIARRGKPDKVLFIQGGDWINIDNINSTTTAGTSVESEKSFPQLLHEANELLISYIDNLRKLAPVDVALVPGNHDNQVSYSMLSYLSAWYRNVDDVNILDKHKYKHRIYTKYGKTVIGASHGRGEKRNQLDSILMNEAKTLWGESDDTEAIFFCGDQHNSKTVESDQTGIPVFQVPSLAGTSTWSHSKGYSARKALSAYIIDREYGIDGVEYANVK